MIQIAFEFKEPEAQDFPGLIRKAILSIHEGTGKQGIAWHGRIRTELFLPRDASVELLLKEEKRMLVLCERVGKFMGPHLWCGADRPLSRTDHRRKGVLVVGGVRTGMSPAPIHEAMRRVSHQVFDREGYSLWETR